MKTIDDAQRDMREAYLGGGPGAATSATAWLIAALVALFVSPMSGILTLVFAGMLIFPVSVLLCKALGRSGKHRKENPLGPLALEGTIWMVLTIPVAIGVAFYRIEWFFPAMLLIIAGRYLTFSTLYGRRIYWVFGAALAVSGFALAFLEAPVVSGAFTGALIEYVFGAVIMARSKSVGPRSSKAFAPEEIQR